MSDNVPVTFQAQTTPAQESQPIIKAGGALRVRQGDWLLTRIDTVDPEGAVLIGPEGAPLTFNDRRAHVLVGTETLVLRNERGDIEVIMVGRDGAVLRHDEHRWIELPPLSTWQVSRQRVVDPTTMEILAVEE